MGTPSKRVKRLPIDVANWVLAYVGENEPLNLYDMANAAYELGFQDAERIAEQKEDEERSVANPFLPPPPIRIPHQHASPECPLTLQYPHHAPRVLEGCTC